MSAAAEAVETLVRHYNDQDATFARMYRKIMREIRPHLNDFEFVVLMFIFDRTYAFGKTAEAIPMDHFINGVKLASGEIIAPRLNASKPKVHRALQRLIDNVIIFKVKKHRTAMPTYIINPAWSVDLSQGRDKLVSKVRLASNTRATHNIEILTCDTQHVAPARTRDAIAWSEEMQPKDALMAAVASATSKNHASRDKRKAKLNATGLEKIWEDAFRTAYPDDIYFKWRQFEQSAFTRAVKRGVPIALLPNFIQFCVASFDNVINSRFSWMKSKPAVNVGFVTKHVAEFYAAFEDDRDPNRKIKRRIKESGDNGQTTVRGKQPSEEAELERLRIENAALKAKVGKTAVNKSNAIKRIIRSRPTASSEFGSWED